MESYDIPFDSVMKSLSRCYVMPRKSDNNNSMFMIVSITIKIITFCFVVIGGFLHFLKVIIEDIEEVDASEDIIVMSAGVGTLLLLGMVSYLHKDWQNLMDDIMDFSTFGKPSNIDQTIKRGNTLGRWFGYYFILGCVIYSVISYLEAPDCNKINEEKQLNLVCDTFIPIWLPFVPNLIYRRLIFLIQLGLIVIAVNPAAMVCFLTYECTKMLEVHTEALKSHFQEIISKKDIKTRPDGIKYWVRYHKHILKMAGDLRALVKKSTGHLTLIAALVIGCAETALVKGVKPIGALAFVIGWSIAIFFLCHAGEILIYSTTSIHDAVRDSDWYLAPNEIKKDVVFILMRCQIPVYLDALPLGIMNYSLFLLMLRTSYSYMTLLNQSV